MGNISEMPSWQDKIYQIERRDRVLGGRGGIANKQAEQLASRTQYLKSRLESIGESKEYTFNISEDDPDGTISGIAGTSSGQTFRVAQGMNSDDLFIYYLNNSGVALPISRALGAGAVERRLPEYNQQPVMVAAFVDDDGNVPVWLENGNLNARGIAQQLVEYIFNNSTAFADVQGYAANYDFSNLLVALFVDEDGNVPVWLDSGYLDALGLGPNLLQFLQDNLQLPQPVVIQDPPVSYGDSLWRWGAAHSKLSLSQVSAAKIGWTGDSWTEWPVIPQAMANILYEKYGKAGDGLLQFGIDGGGPAAATGQQMNGIIIKKSGWSIYDASATTTAPLYGCGPDGMAIFTTGATATLSYSNLVATEITINYWDASGSFRYRIDGGDWQSVICGGQNVARSIVITGLTLATHSVDIDTTGNNGVVSLLNLVAKGTGNGIEIHKMGNGSIAADGYKKVLPYIGYTAKQLDIDVLFMCIGTNDARRNGGLALFESSLDAWVKEWKTACPDMGIVLVIPSQGAGNYNIPLTDIRDATVRVAKKHNAEWIDFRAFMPAEWVKSNSAGMYFDSLHLNDVGARYLANIACNKFLF